MPRKSLRNQLLIGAAVAATAIAAGGPAVANASAEPQSQLWPSPGLEYTSFDDVTSSTEFWTMAKGNGTTDIPNVCLGPTIDSKVLNGASVMSISPSGNGLRVSSFGTSDTLLHLRALCTTPVDLGTAAVGESSQKSLTLKPWPRIASVIGAKIAGADADQFSISTDHCDGKTTGSSESCSITISFRPTSAGAKRASLLIAPKLPGSMTFRPRDVPLAGIGLATIAEPHAR